MHHRFRISLPCQILLSGLAGTVLGVWLGDGLSNPLTSFCYRLADLAASLFLIWTRALAVPLVFSNIVLGTAGLEPMRALSKVIRRTIFWMLGSGLLAVLVGLGAAFALTVPDTHEWTFQATAIPEWTFRGTMTPQNLPLSNLPSAPWGWAALVLLSLGFAYYRNQIEDGHARLIIRLCQGVNEMLTPLLTWTNRLAPVGIFAVLLAYVSRHSPRFWLQASDVLWYPLKALLLGWTIFGLVILPLALWILARVKPWKYFAAMLPATLTAFASGSLEGALPLTMRAAHREAHISHRVAGPVLSLCAVFQREGLAMGWVVIGVCHWRMFGAPENGQFWLAVVLTGWLTALGGGAIQLGAREDSTVLLESMGFRSTGLGPEAVASGFVIMGGAAISVLSHACAAAIIAKGEGEYWVPGPPPSADELQGLKTDLESAEG